MGTNASTANDNGKNDKALKQGSQQSKLSGQNETMAASSTDGTKRSLAKPLSIPPNIDILKATKKDWEVDVEISSTSSVLPFSVVVFDVRRRSLIAGAPVSEHEDSSVTEQSQGDPLQPNWDEHQLTLAHLLELEEWQKLLLGKAAKQRWPTMFKNCRQPIPPPPQDAHPDHGADQKAHELGGHHPSSAVVPDHFFGMDPSAVQRAMFGGVKTALLSRQSKDEKIPSPEEEEFWDVSLVDYSRCLSAAYGNVEHYRTSAGWCKPNALPGKKQAAEDFGRKLLSCFNTSWNDQTDPKHKHGSVLWSSASELSIDLALALKLGDSLRHLVHPLHVCFNEETNFSFVCVDDQKYSGSDHRVAGALDYMKKHNITRCQQLIGEDYYVLSFSFLAGGFETIEPRASLSMPDSTSAPGMEEDDHGTLTAVTDTGPASKSMGKQRRSTKTGTPTLPSGAPHGAVGSSAEPTKGDITHTDQPAEQ